MSDQAPAKPTPDQAEMARLRTSLALDRTLLAWVRTGLTLIGFGFTLSKFMHELIQGGHISNTISNPREIGIAMMTLGIAGLSGGAIDYRRRMKSLHEGDGSQVWTSAFIVSIVLVALSAYVMVSLIIGLYFQK